MISYYWDVETVDINDDVQDHHQGDLTYLIAVFGDIILTGQDETRLVLVRDKENDVDGLVNRQWAYVEDGELPETFDGSAIIPAKIKAEFKKLKG
jgi:hypothetical protein